MADIERTHCPHCGKPLDGHLIASAEIYSYADGDSFRVRDLPIGGTKNLNLLIGTIMLYRGRPISDDDLVRILGSDAKNKGNLVAVYIIRLKAALLAVDGGWPITRRIGAGWMWSGPKVETSGIPI